MNFFENIDWDKYHEIALERAMKDKRPDFPEIPDPVLTSVEDMEEFIKHQIYLDYIWLTARVRYHMDYIWLMESPPMKEGWVQPIFKIDPDSDFVYTYPGKI